LIDAGDNAASFAIMALPSSDQRGAGFDRVQGAAIDIGAIETAPNTPDDGDSTGSQAGLVDGNGGNNNDGAGNNENDTTDGPLNSNHHNSADTAISPGSQMPSGGANEYPMLLLLMAVLFCKLRKTFKNTAGNHLTKKYAIILAVVATQLIRKKSKGNANIARQIVRNVNSE